MKGGWGREPITWASTVSDFALRKRDPLECLLLESLWRRRPTYHSGWIAAQGNSWRKQSTNQLLSAVSWQFLTEELLGFFLCFCLFSSLIYLNSSSVNAARSNLVFKSSIIAKSDLFFLWFICFCADCWMFPHNFIYSIYIEIKIFIYLLNKKGFPVRVQFKIDNIVGYFHVSTNMILRVFSCTVLMWSIVFVYVVLSS